MKKLECIVRTEKFEAVKEALGKHGIKGMTVTHVLGCGFQQGKTEMYRGSSFHINLLPKIKMEVVVADDKVEEVVQLLIKEARTGNVGDGKIFIYPIEDAIRIRTGTRGDEAI